MLYSLEVLALPLKELRSYILENSYSLKSENFFFRYYIIKKARSLRRLKSLVVYILISTLCTRYIPYSTKLSRFKSLLYLRL